MKLYQEGTLHIRAGWPVVPICKGPGCRFCAWIAMHEAQKASTT